MFSRVDDPDGDVSLDGEIVDQLLAQLALALLVQGRLKLEYLEGLEVPLVLRRYRWYPAQYTIAQYVLVLQRSTSTQLRTVERQRRLAS